MAKLKKIAGDYTNPDAIEKVIHYIFNPNKIPSGITGAFSANTMDTELMIHQFNKVQQYHRNCKGKRIIHLVVSFSNDEIALMPKISYTKIGYKILDFIGTEYQSVFALHENKKNLHIHFAINPVNTITGKKYRWQYSTKYLFHDWINYIIHEEVSKYQPDSFFPKS